MHALARKSKMGGLSPGKTIQITTTLYELIEAVMEIFGPGEENLVSSAVLNLMESGAIKWAKRQEENLVLWTPTPDPSAAN